MKKKFIKCITLLLVLIMTFSLTPSVVGGAEGISGLEFYYCNTLQAVTQNASVNGFSKLETLSFSAAKGETEGAQFFVNGSKDVKAYDISVSNLTCGDNVIDNQNIDVYVEIYTVANDSMLFSGTYGAGIYPDCLIPIEYIKNANENNIKNGNNQGFWIDISVPKDVESGVYTGKISFTADNETKVIPVSLEVFDFIMPEAPGLATCYLLWEDWLINIEFDNTTEKQWDYFNTLLDYNISAYVFPNTSPEDFAKSLKEYYSKVNMYGVPYRAISKTVNDWDYYVDYMLAIGEQCKADGINYFDKAYYYFDMFYDEATSFDWRIEQMKAVITTTDEYEEIIINRLVEDGTIIDSTDCAVAKSIRGLQHAITTENYLNDTWEGILDMYVPNSKSIATSAEIEQYKELLDDPDYTIWEYFTGLGDYPNPAANVSDIPVTARDYYWFDYEMGITGQLYWCVNGNVNFSSAYGLSYAPIYNPYNVASHEGISNGDGYYLYPGMNYGSDKPFPSMRLAVRRDGIDDYTYMTELESRYSAKSAEKGVRSVVSFMNERLIKSGRSMLNDTGLLTARESIASLIELYDSFGLVIENLEYTDNGLSLTCFANEGVSVKVNGTSYSNEKRTVELIDYDNLAIECSKNGLSKSVVIATKGKTQIISGFETDSENVITVQTAYGSRAEASTEIFRSGSKSQKIVLSGYTEFADSTQLLAYKPSMYIALSSIGLSEGLSGTESVGFYVYNAGATKNYEIYVQSLSNGITKTNVYDRVTLKSGVWTKIEISNYNIISLSDKDYSSVYRVGLRTDNLYTGNTAFTETLYVDDVFVGRK